MIVPGTETTPGLGMPENDNNWFRNIFDIFKANPNEVGDIIEVDPPGNDNKPYYIAFGAVTVILIILLVTR